MPLVYGLFNEVCIAGGCLDSRWEGWLFRLLLGGVVVYIVVGKIGCLHCC